MSLLARVRKRIEGLSIPESILEKRRAGGKLTAEVLAEVGTSLAEIDWRLLHWLLRYPLQRVDDLVVGVARWVSGATVYRHVQELDARGLVERVLPKTPGAGKRLYYLSNAGLHLLAKRLDRPARELAHLWCADEAGLLRLLPRLPTLLPLQDVVNGLITHAAEAMTTQARRPQLVRWTWQRDMMHRFQYREQTMRLFADSAVALCIRTQQGDGGTLEQWYGLFLLSTELDDERLMRLRLERLLCWRESPERWSSYQHMLPVLIVAGSHRQRDHWQRAVEAAALRLRLEPLAGALAYLPPLEHAQVNPWALNWHTLSTEVTCHPQKLLNPLPRTAFPLSLRLEEGEDKERDAPLLSNTSVAPVSSGRPARLRRLIVGDLASRAAYIIQDGLEEREVIALLGLRLTPCQWSILRLLVAHPLLSDEELGAGLRLQRKSVRCALYALRGYSCLAPIMTGAGKRWHLCSRGLRMIAAASSLSIRTIAVVPDDTTGREVSTMIQRGESWLLQHIQHAAGIYGFFAAVAQATREEPGQALCWWETGAMCERRYRVGEQWYNLRPDALAEYRVGQEQVRFWLEWDRGTMNVRDLVIKCTSYARYIASREWVRDSSRLPRLFCVAPEIAQERRVQRVAQATLTATPGLVLWTTTEGLLNEHGPLAPIWLHGLPQRSQVAWPDGSLRQALSEAMQGKTGTCRVTAVASG